MNIKLKGMCIFAVLVFSFNVMSCGGESSELSNLSEEPSLPENLTVCDDMVRVQYEDPDLEAYGFHSVSCWQGMQVIDDYIYIFGDGDTGFIQEFDIDLVPTGWEGIFVKDRVDIISHPAGIAYHFGYPTFVGGNSIFSIDWNLFHNDRHLDRAVLREILSNGRSTRPEYVPYNGQWYVASVTGGNDDSEMILMDPKLLSEAETLDDPGVIVYRFPVPNLVQDIFWDDFAQNVILVQNIELYKGWRLTSIDIDKAITLGDGTGDAIIKTRCILPTQEPHILISELEGYARLSSKREVFIIANPDLNNNFFMNDITDDQPLP